ncbi:MAG: diacylglycerol/lipid kinase family protein [Streptosporangiaceae bacterium]
MSKVAVVAHAHKKMGGGLPELRAVLAREGLAEPLWFEVNKSRKAPAHVRRALAKGAELIFVWGGDGMVQRCVDAVAGTKAVLAILPAGTANLLAANLNIPADLAAAVRVGLHGQRRKLDTGTVNGEHFVVMAGTGFDALMIRGASRRMKRRLGRLAYIYTGTKNLSACGMKADVKVDGQRFYKGRLSCVLVGNVGKLFGGVEVFGDARPDDGVLEVGLVTADRPAQWARTFGRLAAGSPEKSPFVKVTSGHKIRISLNEKMPYELDGGDRKKTRKLRIKVHPSSVRICVPVSAATEVTPLPAADVLAPPGARLPRQPAPAGP